MWIFISSRCSILNGIAPASSGWKSNAGGTFTHPDVNGTVHLIDASFQAPDSPLGAQKVNAALAIKNGRVDIQSFTGKQVVEPCRCRGLLHTNLPSNST